MIRKLAVFYLLGMGLSFVITLWVGAAGADFVRVMSFALLSWPLAAMMLLAHRSFVRLRNQDFQRSARFPE